MTNRYPHDNPYYKQLMATNTQEEMDKLVFKAQLAGTHNAMIHKIALLMKNQDSTAQTWITHEFMDNW